MVAIIQQPDLSLSDGNSSQKRIRISPLRAQNRNMPTSNAIPQNEPSKHTEDLVTSSTHNSKSPENNTGACRAAEKQKFKGIARRLSTGLATFKNIQHNAVDATSTINSDLRSLVRASSIMISGINHTNNNDASTDALIVQTKINAVLKNPALFQMYQDNLSKYVARYKPWGCLQVFQTFLDEYIRIPEIKQEIIERKKKTECGSTNNGRRRLLSFLTNHNPITNQSCTPKPSRELFQRLTGRSIIISRHSPQSDDEKRNKSDSATSTPSKSSSTSSETASPFSDKDGSIHDDGCWFTEEDFLNYQKACDSPGSTPPMIPNLDLIESDIQHPGNDDDNSDVFTCSDSGSTCSHDDEITDDEMDSTKDFKDVDLGANDEEDCGEELVDMTSCLA